MLNAVIRLLLIRSTSSNVDAELKSGRLMFEDAGAGENNEELWADSTTAGSLALALSWCCDAPYYRFAKLAPSSSQDQPCRWANIRQLDQRHQTQLAALPKIRHDRNAWFFRQQRCCAA
jgi:hypothetical protein